MIFVIPFVNFSPFSGPFVSRGWSDFSGPVRELVTVDSAILILEKPKLMSGLNALPAMINIIL